MRDQLDKSLNMIHFIIIDIINLKCLDSKIKEKIKNN